MGPKLQKHTPVVRVAVFMVSSWRLHGVLWPCILLPPVVEIPTLEDLAIHNRRLIPRSDGHLSPAVHRRFLATEMDEKSYPIDTMPYSAAFYENIADSCRCFHPIHYSGLNQSMESCMPSVTCCFGNLGSPVGSPGQITPKRCYTACDDV